MISTDAYRALAELRHQIRRFLAFSEAQARAAGVEPQQHQLLLAVKGLPAGQAPTIRNVAARLLLRHNSVVELTDRLEAHALIERHAAPDDRRVIHLRITAKGERMLSKLSEAHAAELRRLGPAMAAAIGVVAVPSMAASTPSMSPSVSPPTSPSASTRRRRGSAK